MRHSIERGTRASRIGGLAAIVVLAGLLSMPWWADRSQIRTATEFLYILALAQMWNLLTGFGGLLSIGQQGFIGLGGYTLVIFGLKLGLNPFLTVPLAGLVALVVAIPTAAAVFRLRGAYFAVGTWVVAEVFENALANVAWVGGGQGTSVTRTMMGIPVWWRDGLTFWSAAVLGIGSIVLIYLLLRSRLGLALTAVRDSEPASGSIGITVSRVKWMVYLASAFGCGATGALIYITKLRISPPEAFSVDWTAIMFFIVVIGGIGTLEGPILGTLIYFILRETLANFGAWYLIVLGLVAVLIMLTMRRGIWGFLAARWDIHLFPVQRRVVIREE